MPDRLDSRELLKEWNELENLDEDDLDENDDKEAIYDHRNALDNLLKELQDNCDEDVKYGIQLIPKDDFAEYAQELAEDIGYMGMQLVAEGIGHNYSLVNKRVADQWPFRHIDWKEAADELAEDYYEVEFEGVTYLAR